MNDRPQRAMLTLSIAAVERDTGLSKDTLRVWERRYGFPAPDRDPSGERAYPLDQVERLRLIRRLLDAGHRPGRTVPLDLVDLQRLAEAAGPEPMELPRSGWDAAALDDYLALVRQHDLEGLRRQFGRDLARVGLPIFVCELVVPLTRSIGDAWLRGQMQVFEEHACTEVLQSVLRTAVGALPPPEPLDAPRVLLSTLPGEPHALAMQLDEALLRVEGVVSVPLGPQTPVWDLVLAAEAYRCDVVALGFSGSTSPGATFDALAELRSKLPARVALWVGGNAPVLQRRRIEGVRPFEALQDIPAAVADWRARQP
jgi:MerR family transcriptional regulator, light-induced transcriptional regulator